MKLTQDQQDIAVHMYYSSCRGIIEMIGAGEFKSMPMPEKNTFHICESCGSRCKNEIAEQIYKQEMEIYRTVKLFKREQFKFICMFDLNLKYGAAHTEKAWEIAWDNSSGILQDVYYELIDLAELLAIKE